MTTKERLQQVVAEMTEDEDEAEAEVALTLVTGARAGATPVNLYGTAWERVLEGIDPETLAVSGDATIVVPAGIPSVE